MNSLSEKALWVVLCFFITSHGFAYDSSHFIWGKLIEAPDDSVEILNYLIKVNTIDYRSIPLSDNQRNTLKSMANVNHATQSLNLIPQILKKLDSFNPKIKKLTPIFAQYYRIHDFLYGKLPKNLYIKTAQEIKNYDTSCHIYPIMASLIGKILKEDYDIQLDSTIIDLLNLENHQYSLMLLCTVSSCLEKVDTLRIIEQFRSQNKLLGEDLESLDRIIRNIKKENEAPNIPFKVEWYVPLYSEWIKNKEEHLFPFKTIVPKTRATVIID